LQWKSTEGEKNSLECRELQVKRNTISASSSLLNSHIYNPEESVALFLETNSHGINAGLAGHLRAL